MRSFHIAVAAAAAILLSQHPAVAMTTRPIGPGVAPSAPGAFVMTATRAVGPALRNAVPIGMADPRMPLHVIVALRMRDPQGAMNLVYRETTPGSPYFGTSITPAQFTAMFNPSPQQVQAVVAHLARNGFQQISVEPNNLFVSAYGTTSQATSAFNTHIALYRQSNRVVYANVDPAGVPSTLRGTVLSVLGLTNAGQMHKNIRYSNQNRMHTMAPKPCDLPTSSLCLINSYGPQDFQIFYDAAKGPNGWGLPVAVFAEGNVSQVINDLRAYETHFGLPKVAYSVRPVGIPSPDVAGLDEWDLDTQSSTGIAQTVGHMYVYDTTSLSDSDIALEFSKFVSDDVAKLGNASFGECETFAQIDGSAVADDQSFLQGAAQGQTVFSSTGDNGNGCPVVAATGVPGTAVPEDSYPASSPYVVGVGGTTIVSNAPGGTYNSEITWIGTGGGVSNVEASPYWQAGPVNTVYRTVGKTIPDISMDADPDTGALIYVNGAQTGVGGTSLSSPLSMGVSARIIVAQDDHNLPFLAPLFYQLWEAYVPGCTATTCVPPVPPAGATTQYIGGYHDILFGSNGGPYGTLPGYDLETGLGTLDIYKMQTAMQKLVGDWDKDGR